MGRQSLAVSAPKPPCTPFSLVGGFVDYTICAGFWFKPLPADKWWDEPLRWRPCALTGQKSLVGDWESPTSAPWLATQGKISYLIPSTPSDPNCPALPGHLSNAGPSLDICQDLDFTMILQFQCKWRHSLVNIYIFDTYLRPIFSFKWWRNPIITKMVMVRVQYCGVNDGFWIQRASPSFYLPPATRRLGRQVLAPRDPSYPATLPTLPLKSRLTAQSALQDRQLAAAKALPTPPPCRCSRGRGLRQVGR